MEFRVRVEVRCAKCGHHIEMVDGFQSLPMNMRIVTTQHTCDCNSREMEIRIVCQK